MPTPAPPTLPTNNHGRAPTPAFSPTRRNLLIGAAAAGVAAVSPAAALARAGGSGRARAGSGGRGRARNLIFMVADGMSTGTLTLADLVRHVRDGTHANWVSLWGREHVRRASATTYSADSWVTDSAAGASAWGIGQRVNNKAVNFAPDGRTPMPILVQSKQSGKAIGLVTTTTVTHATPAGFIANVPDRSMEKEIAAQIVGRGADVVLGGGARFFTDKVLAGWKGGPVLRTAADLRAAVATPTPSGVLGLFKDSHASFELDRPETEPSLEDMTRAALTLLRDRADGFVLQVEGGRVDHACHSNDAGAAVADMLAFDRAIGAVLGFADGRDDTLVIITTDHGNGNPGLTLYERDSHEGLAALGRARHSFEWIEQEAKRRGLAHSLDEGYEHGRPIADAGSADALAAIVEEATSVKLTASEVATLGRSLAGEAVNGFAPMNARSSALGSVLANHTGVAFASPNHTADAVEVTALGPGSEPVRGQINNYDLHAVMVDAMDLAPAR